MASYEAIKGENDFGPNRSSPNPNSSHPGAPAYSNGYSPNLNENHLSPVVDHSPSFPSPDMRRGRPASLYIPMDDGVTASPNGGGNTPTWPFQPNGEDSPSYQPPLQAPLSPSMIHPSYADSVNGGFNSFAPGMTDSPPRPNTPPTPLPPQHLHSSIPLGPGAQAPAYTSSAYHNVNTRSVSPLGSGLVSGKASSPYDNRLSSSGRSLPFGGARQKEAPQVPDWLQTPTAMLIWYFFFNLSLTIFNKVVLQGFPFPWTLTAIQMLSGTIGTQVLLSYGFFTQARLNTSEQLVMLAFSCLYTINIAVSNLSLQLVTVPFHQVVRAMTPLFTVIIGAVCFHKRNSRDTYLALLPVVLGVALATYGDYDFTAWGLILTLIGALLAAFKTIVTNRIQVGRLKLHPLDLLIRMSPLAFMQCVLWGWYSGELDRVREYGATEMTQHKAIALVINGAIAFGLNIVSFTANKKTSALTMTVAANVKQVLTIILAVAIFNVKLGILNGFGILATLIGGALYAKVEMGEKARSTAAKAAEAEMSQKRPLTG